MKKAVEAQAGLSLMIGSLLIMLTMVLHPTGGSVEYLVKITTGILISHSIALLAMPFCWVGFWGITRRLSESSFLSLLAFAFSSMGLLAGICAAAVNGLMLPLYLNQHPPVPGPSIGPIKSNLTLMASLNHAFDFIFIGAICLAVLSWSVVIIRTKELPVWLGWLGLFLPLIPMVLVLSNLSLVHLTGFRVFTLGLATWIISVGYGLQKPVEYLK